MLSETWASLQPGFQDWCIKPEGAG